MKSNYRGFTLIEVLVAVGVLSVSTLAFLPSFSKANREKNLNQNAEVAKDVLLTARNKALTQVGNPSAESKYTYSGVRFTRDSEDAIYFRSTAPTRSICNTVADLSNGGSNTTTVRDATKKFSGGVVARITEADNPTCIFFEFGTGNSFITKGKNVGADEGPTYACADAAAE